LFSGIEKQKQKNENFASKTAKYGPWLIIFFKILLVRWNFVLFLKNPLSREDKKKHIVYVLEIVWCTGLYWFYETRISVEDHAQGSLISLVLAQLTQPYCTLYSTTSLSPVLVFLLSVLQTDA
jgi:hypothetical protein